MPEMTPQELEAYRAGVSLVLRAAKKVLLSMHQPRNAQRILEQIGAEAGIEILPTPGENLQSSILHLPTRRLQ